MHIISQRRRAAGVAIHGLVSLIKISRARRAAGVAIHGLVSLIKIFRAPPYLFSLNCIRIIQNRLPILHKVSRRAAGVAIHSLVSLKKFFSGTASPTEINF